MLIKDPNKRPSMRKILEKEFLSKRISKLLTATIARNEFTSTFINRHLAIQPAEEEKDADIAGEGVTAENNKINTSKPKLNIKPGHKDKAAVRFSQNSVPTTNQLGRGMPAQTSSVSQSQQQLPGVSSSGADYDQNSGSAAHHQASGGRFGSYKTGQVESKAAKVVERKSSQNQAHYNQYIAGQIGEDKSPRTHVQPKASHAGLGGPQMGHPSVVKAGGSGRPPAESANASDSGSESDEENPLGEEPVEMRVSPEFLKNLPGVQASDSMGYRIEALRVYLETQLGEQPFVAAYKHFVSLQTEDTEADIEHIIGASKMKFVPLIHHLIICEDSFYSAEK